MVFLLLTLAGCPNDGEPVVPTGEMHEGVCTDCGHWVHIDAPPHSAEFDIDCWAWVYSKPTNAAAWYGGPVCVPMGD